MTVFKPETASDPQRSGNREESPKLSTAMFQCLNQEEEGKPANEEANEEEQPVEQPEV